MPDVVRDHCEEIDRCNQRGGRMLSIVDLLQAGTMTPDLAAFALDRIGAGASFLVGALPGGAGKTTVMGALLNFVPAGTVLVPTDSVRVIQQGVQHPTPRCCFVCHEIGRGPYYAYLWGEALQAYCSLPTAGHQIATNLHADTYAQARQQIVVENGVPEDDFRRFELLFFLRVEGSAAGTRRTVQEVWESDGAREHQPVYRAGQGDTIASPAARARLDAILATGCRTISEVRAAVLGG